MSSALSASYKTMRSSPSLRSSRAHTRASDEGKALSDLRRAPTDGMVRFAEVEMLAVLAIVVDKYRIEVTEDPKYAFETTDERKGRVLDAHHGVITLIPYKTSLTFKIR